MITSWFQVLFSFVVVVCCCCCLLLLLFSGLTAVNLGSSPNYLCVAVRLLCVEVAEESLLRESDESVSHVSHILALVLVFAGTRLSLRI